METSPNLPNGPTSIPTYSQAALLASPPVVLGSAEARRTTAGSGLRLLTALSVSSRLSSFSKTLLGSLLSTEAWRSDVCMLEWRVSATTFANRLLFQLAPWEPDTDECGYGLLPTLSATELNRGPVCTSADHPWGQTLSQRIKGLMPTLQAADGMGGGRHLATWKQAREKSGGGCANLRDYLSLLPTLTARDWRSEKSNITTNARPLSEVLGQSRLKLTSAFCERFMGYPEGWTSIADTESKPLEIRLYPKSPRKS